jgi:hypothetical protein
MRQCSRRLHHLRVVAIAAALASAASRPGSIISLRMRRQNEAANPYEFTFTRLGVQISVSWRAA